MARCVHLYHHEDDVGSGTDEQDKGLRNRTLSNATKTTSGTYVTNNSCSSSSPHKVPRKRSKTQSVRFPDQPYYHHQKRIEHDVCLKEEDSGFNPNQT